MRVVAFHRGVSEDRKKHIGSGSGDSLSLAMEEYCHKNEHKLVELLSPPDGWWDDRKLREQYQKMLDLFKPPHGRPALILIPDASHLGSRLDTLVERLIELDDLRCQVRCLDKDLPDPLQNAEANLELNGVTTSTRRTQIRKSLLESASRGAVLGRTPYGYAKGSDGKFVIDETEAAVVRKIFAIYTNQQTVGRGMNKPLGLRRMASSLNKEGLRTRHAKPWNPTALINILRNRVYLGSYTRCGMRIVGNHPAIIETHIFNYAKDILERRRPSRKNESEQNAFLMAGMVYCSTCDNKMSGVSRRRIWTKQDGQKMEKVYRYYECPLKNDGREHGLLRSDHLHKRVLKWADKLGKRHTQKAYGEYVNGTKQNGSYAGVKQADRDFKGAVRLVSQGHGTLNDLRDILANYRALYNQNEIISDTAVADDLTTDSIFVEKNSDQHIHSLSKALSAVLDKVDVLDAKNISFYKSSLKPAAA